MNNLAINGEQIRVPVIQEGDVLRPDWTEITLEQAIEVHKAIKKLPHDVLKMYELAIKEETIEEAEELEQSFTEQMRLKDIPTAQVAIMRAIAPDLPGTITHRVAEEIDTIFNTVFLPFVLGLMFAPMYERRSLASFTHEGVEYWMPKSTRIGDDERPMSQTGALEFTESADLIEASRGLEGGKWDNMALVIAILCRPNVLAGTFTKEHPQEAIERDIARLPADWPVREPYNEERSLNRAPKFLTMKMHDVFEVFFYLLERWTISTTYTATSLLRAGREEIQKLPQH